ncbi:signal peptidase I [Gottfriedia sp. NPDC056225]|uniref:signal peptidase I n=1 Tax=Gottfriedia sp. NPDC056225 TaxID=3345751 RepID=UPI00155932EA|nr:signal peptidase I [Arthrobacter citreus]
MRVFGRFINILLVIILLTLGYKIIQGKLEGKPPTFFGHQVYYVLSGSMEPTLPTGSVIIVKDMTSETKLSTGDIITFKMPYNEETLVTHRINEVINEDGELVYRTKGDANEIQDPWIIERGSIVAVYSGVKLPLVGYIYKEIHKRFSIYLLLTILGLILISYGIKLINNKRD